MAKLMERWSGKACLPPGTPVFAAEINPKNRNAHEPLLKGDKRF